MTNELVTIGQARELIELAARPLPAEQVPIDEALGRTLAADLYAAADVPRFRSSAMDGYALRSGPSTRTLELVGESRAGAPSGRTLQAHQAMRISTGGAVPAGADAVIRQEDVTSEDGTIATRTEVTPGENIRQPGEDIRGGSVVLTAGTTLGALELGVAVAAGAGELAVHRMPKVRVLCTGDELRAPGDPLGPGQIHNSNAPTLTALARRAGGNPTAPAQRLPDDPAQTEHALEEALRHADVVLISGGISVGPHDHVKQALAALGVEQRFWGVALKPGKPTWFGTKDETLVFGLPGNPVSVVVTFALFAQTALDALQGRRPASRTETHATLGTPVKRNPTREQALRVRLERRNGTTVATPSGNQGSHVLTSLVTADALALIPRGDGVQPEGSTVVLEYLPR
jgi:molybdopterin molybdotransferase